MAVFRKLLLAGAVASTAALAGSAADERADRLDALFAELAEPGREDWARIEREIQRLWSQSGSPAMDLLLRRGSEAMGASDHEGAVEHLSALTDHAPQFAEGWNARATAFFYMGEYSLSLGDIQRTLALEPRHFGALEGMAAILEEMGRVDVALEALRAAHRLNPNRPSVQAAMARLGRKAGAADL